MSRSIFDPTCGAPEHSGSTFTRPDADQISHLPAEFTNPPSVPTGTVDSQPPPKRPAIEVSAENDGKLLVIRMTGKLHKDDYQHFVPIVEKAVQKNGKVRMLVQMHNFHGWDAGALWEDVKFDLQHFNHIERLAVVGEKTWEKWMAMFCKAFTTATIRYFSSEHTDEARAWITAP
ncbi:MAG: STAS/SEC14 domain-containing protein [Tepidisphaeraceae bacterium]